MYSTKVNTQITNKVLLMADFNSKSVMDKNTGMETITFNCLKQFNKFNRLYRKFLTN